VVIEVAWKSGVLAQGGLLLVGDRGEAWYEGTLTRGDSARLRLTEGENVVLDEPRSPYDEYVESFYLLEREFVDCMLGHGRTTQAAQEYLKTLNCTFAAYQAIDSGGPVAIAEDVD
jgi:hypothetical protein